MMTVTSKGDPKKRLLSVNLNWETKVFWPLRINLEQANYDLKTKSLDSNAELLVTCSGSVH